MFAYWISRSAVTATDAPGTPPSSRAEGPAGIARTTASAVRYSSSCAEPTVSRQPEAVRDSPRTIAEVRTVAPEVAATAAGSDPSPAASVVNTGGREDPAGAWPAR